MTGDRTVKIKICGLKRPEDIGYVNEALPDYAGFVVEVHGSRRSVDRDAVRRLSAGLDDRIIPIGVFVDAPPELPAGLLKEGIITVAQLHGCEDEKYIEQLREMTDGTAKIMKAFSVTSDRDIEAAWKCSADMILLDQGTGGTGKVFDWSLARGMGRPYFLAGGLGIGNLAEAIRILSPWAVDLSSGVETDGYKDRKKISEAVAIVRGAVREADGESGGNDERK